MTRLDLEKFFVGLDPFYNLPQFNSKVEYPRYNIGKLENGYSIMVALPGWSKEDVTVTFHEGMLNIKGLKQEETDPVNWVHKGISGKSFERSFGVSQDLEVKKVNLKNGMLYISLEYTPSSKPVVIPIT